jgi:hypothetical protein
LKTLSQIILRCPLVWKSQSFQTRT